jgi:hypothetical protein
LKDYKNLDNFIEDQIQHSDTYSGVNREELFNLCEELGIKSPPKKTLKMDLVYYLIENGVTWRQLYDRYKSYAFGIHPSYVEEKFNLNKSQRKKMEDLGFLEVAYKVRTKVFTATYADVSYYSAEQFFNLTIEDVEKWKCENIRGYRKKVEQVRNYEEAMIYKVNKNDNWQDGKRIVVNGEDSLYDLAGNKLEKVYKFIGERLGNKEIL